MATIHTAIAMPHLDKKQLGALQKLALAHGIQTEYLDVSQRTQRASEESLLGTLNALGVPARRTPDLASLLRQTLQARAQEVLPAVQIVWQPGTPTLSVQLPRRLANTAVGLEIRSESGEMLRQDENLGRLNVENRRRIEGVEYVTKHIPIRGRLPIGYHELELQSKHGQHRTHLICAPVRSYSRRSEGRRWGVFAPLYALHSKRSWGAGDFGDLQNFTEWISTQGGDTVATLPLLPAFLDDPCEPSPYSPVSRLFWNEFYIDIEAIPELHACPAALRLVRSRAFEKRCQRLRDSELVNYREQMAAKREVLEILSRFVFSKPSRRRDLLEQHLQAQPRIGDYARFRATCERHGTSWTQWSARMRKGTLLENDFDPAVRNYHLYAQWIAQEQMEDLSSTTRQRGLRLYLDMPLGVHSQGYDAWREQALFAFDASGGAPPDSVFTRGQDWGFAPLHPERCRTTGHHYLKNYLRHHLRHASILRIDHIMGLHRLYWVPRGMPANHGAYVSYPAEEQYAVLSIESHRHSATIVGENLGTVPPEVDQSLKRHRIRGMFVSQYEVAPPPRKLFRTVPKHSVASLNTHDMPPFAAFCAGLDLEDRLDLGLLKPDELPAEQLARSRILASLRKLLHRQGTIGDDGPFSAEDLLTAGLGHLSISSAELVLINLEDLLLEVQSQNVPGTTLERLNWCRKTRLSMEQLKRNRKLRDLLSSVNSQRAR
ncbi:MAG: 4-alpha-glucanotransferase [Verrucomicrobia bacterium]|nr:4-alpha-glucanotransferase [Verrucomicrobiota bacterium]